MKSAKPKNVDEYISGFPKDVQKKLAELRTTIRKATPDAEEIISYQMPAYSLNGNLVYFAAYKNHIGFYQTASGIKNFESNLSKYESSKGAVKFSIDKPLPLGLITKIVKFRVKENLAKEKQPIKLKT
ncbi:MAG: iron chaperone [Ginsengibacter sp.]